MRRNEEHKRAGKSHGNERIKVGSVKRKEGKAEK